MTIAEILEGGGALVLVAMTLVQISPLKINPWSWLAKKLGRAINSEVITKVDALGKDVQGLRSECDEREAKAARVRILRFGDEIYQDAKHSKDHFDQILEDIREYELYCAGHPLFKNEMTATTVKIIKHTYENCLREHSFL